MRRINIKINVKRFTSKLKHPVKGVTILGYFRGWTQKGQVMTAHIDVSEEQSPQELISTVIHELTHALADYTTGRLYPLNKSTTEVAAEEALCAAVEKATLDLYNAWHEERR